MVPRLNTVQISTAQLCDIQTEYSHVVSN